MNPEDETKEVCAKCEYYNELGYYTWCYSGEYQFTQCFNLSTLQTFPENHLGRIYYNAHYDDSTESFNVYIHRIRNLPKVTPEAGKIQKTYLK